MSVFCVLDAAALFPTAFETCARTSTWYSLAPSRLLIVSEVVPTAGPLVVQVDHDAPVLRCLESTLVTPTLVEAVQDTVIDVAFDVAETLVGGSTATVVTVLETGLLSPSVVYSTLSWTV